MEPKETTKITDEKQEEVKEGQKQLSDTDLNEVSGGMGEQGKPMDPFGVDLSAGSGLG